MRSGNVLAAAMMIALYLLGVRETWAVIARWIAVLALRTAGLFAVPITGW